MTLPEAVRLLLPFSIFAVVLVLVLISLNKQLRQVNEMLVRVAESSGWTNLETSSFLRASVRGLWRQFPVELRYGQHQKNAPRRLTLLISAHTDQIIDIRRRFGGLFSNRPLTWFGPPLIDVHQPSASPMWVRGGAQLAERLFADPNVAALIATNLVRRFDRIVIDSKALRMTRSLEGPGARFRFDAAVTERIAREMIELAETIVGKLT